MMLTERQQRLLATIEEAFNGVILGDGVSLHQTIVIDNYGSLEEEQAARSRDEKHDWRKLIGDPEFSQIFSIGGLSFYDAAGLRFHLAAYLSLAVTNIEFEPDVISSLIFHLTNIDEHNRSRFSVLNSAQRQCIRDFLLFFRDESGWDCPEIDSTVITYWNSATDEA